MEHSSPNISHGRNQHIKGNEATETNRFEMLVKGVSAPVTISPRNNAGAKIGEWTSGEVLFKDANQENVESSGEVNMEASIAPEDVIRAGGFGARDDISSFLPVASDSTDFEASIRDARDYEDAQGEVRRPGLGWTKGSKTE